MCQRATAICTPISSTPGYCACCAIAANGSATSCATNCATTCHADHPLARTCRCALGAFPTAHPRPGIAQADGAVEHEMAWRRVRIAAEITLPLSLDGIAGVCGSKLRFELAARQHLERIGVEIGDEGGGVRGGARKQRG